MFSRALLAAYRHCRRKGRGLDFGARISDWPLAGLEELDLTLLVLSEATNALRLMVTGRGLLVCFIINWLVYE